MASGRPAPVAVRAHDLALLDLGDECRPPNTAAHERCDVGPLGPHVIELEDNRIRLAAVAARMRPQVLEDESLSLANPLRLQGVASLPMVISLLDVIRLETVAAPPLET
jgi:hypothetical protein